MVEFLAWLDREAPKGKLTEIDVVKALEGFRRATNALHDISFDTICGAGPERRHRPLPRDRRDEPQGEPGRAAADRLGRPVCRRHDRHHPHRRRRRGDRGTAPASPASCRA
jgi:hypothetical protein